MIKAAALYSSTIGKKAIMAVTGIIGFFFVLGHMIGNLQAFPIFGGEAALNAYGEFLRNTHGLLWVARFTLLMAVTLHIWAAYSLTRTSWSSRPRDYSRWKAVGSSYASRTMRWSGPMIALFLIYHLLDLTFGPTNPDFMEGEVYHNLVVSMQRWYVSIFYIAAMLALAFHLYHGIWSMLQSLGLNNPIYNRWLRRLAVIFTFVIMLGFIAVPIGVLTGIIS